MDSSFLNHSLHIGILQDFALAELFPLSLSLSVGYNPLLFKKQIYYPYAIDSHILQNRSHHIYWSHVSNYLLSIYSRVPSLQTPPFNTSKSNSYSPPMICPFKSTHLINWTTIHFYRIQSVFICCLFFLKHLSPLPLSFPFPL